MQTVEIVQEEKLNSVIQELFRKHPWTKDNVLFASSRTIAHRAADAQAVDEDRGLWGRVYDQALLQPKNMVDLYNQCWDVGQYEGNTRFPLTVDQLRFLDVDSHAFTVGGEMPEDDAPVDPTTLSPHTIFAISKVDAEIPGQARGNQFNETKTIHTPASTSWAARSWD